MRLPGDGMGWKEFALGLKQEITDDNVTDLAATVTYYGVLALFPFLLFLVALASVIITPQQAEQLVQQLSHVAPPAVTQIVGDRIKQLATGQNVTLLGFGALGALWAASGATTAVMRALNACYDVAEQRPFWKVRVVAILMTLAASVLALVAALVAIAAAPVGDAVGGPVGAAITWLRLPVAGLVMMFLWAVCYYALPDVEQAFKFITPGSVIGVVLWIAASWGFSKYVTSFGSYDKTYGSIAGVIVLLLWMWISALVMLVGAEINALIEHRSPEGKRQGAKSMRDSGLAPAVGADVSRPAVARGGPPAEAEPARAGGDGGLASRTRARVVVRPRGRGPLRGIAAIAAGFAAGVLIARREA